MSKVYFASVISVGSTHIYEKRKGCGAGSVPLTKGSGSRRPKTCGSCGSGFPTLISRTRRPTSPRPYELGRATQPGTSRTVEAGGGAAGLERGGGEGRLPPSLCGGSVRHCGCRPPAGRTGRRTAQPLAFQSVIISKQKMIVFYLALHSFPSLDPDLLCSARNPWHFGGYGSGSSDPYL